MAGNGKELGQQLKELISSLQDQGILNDYFDELKGLQEEHDPCFVRECIAILLREAHDYRAELTTNLCLVGLDNVNREYLVNRENLNRIAGMECAIYENEAGPKAT